MTLPQKNREEKLLVKQQKEKWEDILPGVMPESLQGSLQSAVFNAFAKNLKDGARRRNFKLSVNCYLLHRLTVHRQLVRRNSNKTSTSLTARDQSSRTMALKRKVTLL